MAVRRFPDAAGFPKLGFGTHYFGYGDPAGFFYNPNEFTAFEKTRAEFWIGIAAAFILAIITARIGLAWGKWMEEIRR